MEAQEDWKKHRARYLPYFQPSNASEEQKRSFIVKFRINWALSNSLNTYNRHSDWKPKLTVLRRT